MSLLNDVLKDLKEKKQGIPEAAVLGGKQKSHALPRLSVVSPWLAAPFISTALIIVMIFAYGINQQEDDEPEAYVSETTQLAVVDEQTMAPSTVPSVWIKEAIVQHQPSFVPAMPTPVIRPFEREALAEPFQEVEHVHVDKVFAPLSDTEWHDEQLHQALIAIQDNRDDDAELILNKILARFPKAIVARETLANLYLAQEHYDSARQTVDAGLTFVPNAISLNLIKARLLFEEKQPKQALQLLKQFSPGMSKYPDYYGLMAAILESLGQYQEAAALYKVLVKVDQSNAQYWLGYGLALEREHNTKQAISAYKAIVDYYDADPDVRVFAENRLKTLQG